MLQKHPTCITKILNQKLLTHSPESDCKIVFSDIVIFPTWLLVDERMLQEFVMLHY